MTNYYTERQINWIVALAFVAGLLSGYLLTVVAAS